jgi:succinyl-CoA synthetase beta subunit
VGGIVGFDDAMRLLTEAGVPVAPYAVLREGDADLRALSALGPRVVLKLADVPHRTELGAVAVDVGPSEVEATIARLTDIARAEGVPATIAVQQMIDGHGEAFGGVQSRTDLGPLVLLGMGGVLVEARGQVGGRFLPLDRPAAEALALEVAGPEVFAGLRGQKAWPVEPLVRVVLALGELWRRQGAWLASADVNPLIVTDDGVVAVDALLVAGGDV